MSEVTLAAAARHGKISPRTLRRYIDAGRLPARRVGPKLWRVNTSDVDALFRPVGEPEAEPTPDVVAYVTALVEAAPPLSESQRDRLAELLRDVRAGAAG